LLFNVFVVASILEYRRHKAGTVRLEQRAAATIDSISHFHPGHRQCRVSETPCQKNRPAFVKVCNVGEIESSAKIGDRSSMNYRLLIDYEVIEFMEKLPRKDQRQLRDRLVSLQKFPSRFSDYIESDSEDRRSD
jgi:hypothetical protein